jgi:hypothetical protein
MWAYEQNRGPSVFGYIVAMSRTEDYVVKIAAHARLKEYDPATHIHGGFLEA